LNLSARLISHDTLFFSHNKTTSTGLISEVLLTKFDLRARFQKALGTKRTVTFCLELKRFALQQKFRTQSIQHTSIFLLNTSQKILGGRTKWKRKGKKDARASI